MSITIEYQNKEETEWTVDYGAKRNARYYQPLKSEITDEQEELLIDLQEFVMQEVQISNLLSMSDEKIFSLIERIARTFCGKTAPKRDYGLDKSVIRWAILETIQRLLREVVAVD